MGTTQAQFNFTNFSMWNALVPAGGPKAYPLAFQFIAGGGASDAYTVDLTLPIEQGKVDLVQTLFIDNSPNTVPLTVSVGALRENITVPARYQGFFPIVMPQKNAVLTVSCPTGNNAEVMMLNVPMPAMMWPTVQTIPSFSGLGYLQVSDVALDALITGGTLPVTGNVVGDNQKIYPDWFGTLRATGQQTAVGPTAMITAGAGNGLFITDIDISLSNATLAAAGELTITITETTTGTIFTLGAELPAAVPGVNLTLLNKTGMKYNVKHAAASISITLSAALTNGHVNWNIGWGNTTIVG